MGIQDYFSRRSATPTPAFEDEELIADIDEPPDHQITPEAQTSTFRKSTIRPSADRGESLLTKALLSKPQAEFNKPDIRIATDLTRRRSMISNASLASTAELTSDGGFTSPARTSTPSPPPPTTFTSFAPFTLIGKTVHPQEPIIAKQDVKGVVDVPEVVSPHLPRPVDDLPKRRCISFACDGKKGTAPVKPTATAVPSQPAQPTTTVTTEAPKRKCMIQFACTGPKPSHTEKPVQDVKTPPAKAAEKLHVSKSPTPARRSARAGASPSTLHHRDSTSTIRRASKSPVAVRTKPKYIIADEKTLLSSEATRFHEFASENLQDDDWIVRDSDAKAEKLTIDDTLKKENAIRRLGSEAEEEALEDEEAEEEEDRGRNESDDENDFDDEDEELDDDDAISIESSEGSDGNETDNEAGFADSDDESDAGGEFAFWTPGRELINRQKGEPSTYRPSAHRTASTSSIDSLHHMSPPRPGMYSGKPRRRPIKIRPGTPELPDSTDFVCGTLDEDRPLEDAYVSCMEAKRHAKHKLIPQDIDPSFPTSDIEDEEDEEDVLADAHDSDEHVWLHGKFEEDEDHHRPRQSTATHHSPRRLHSPPPPRRLHSPPPAKHRLRSPPPRKLFGAHSPKRMRSPPPSRTIQSPPASPMSDAASNAITFVPLGSRPGLTHTKSLPRTPNAFCRQYTASRLAAANGNPEGSDSTDPHIRGAIDIKKGLENKRQRRKEKLLRKKHDKPERKPQPGRGAERMRELGLLMAGKTGPNNPYILSA